MMLFFFFFSSRRRHTRFDCDWSSDVCSSDLVDLDGTLPGAGLAGQAAGHGVIDLVREIGLAAARRAAVAPARGQAGQEGLGPLRDLRSEEHTSELQSQSNLVCRLLLEKKKTPSAA